jgi:hypothetical protein
MDLWNILVLGTIRLNCDWDYDKLVSERKPSNPLTVRVKNVFTGLKMSLFSWIKIECMLKLPRYY